jgi:hypothetical protein
MRDLANATVLVISTILLAACQTSPVVTGGEATAMKMDTAASSSYTVTGGGGPANSGQAANSSAARSAGEATKDAIGRCGC